MNPITPAPEATLLAAPNITHDTSPPTDPPISHEKETKLDLTDGRATPTEKPTNKHQKPINTTTATPGVTFQVTPNPR